MADVFKVPSALSSTASKTVDVPRVPVSHETEEETPSSAESNQNEGTTPTMEETAETSSASSVSVVTTPSSSTTTEKNADALPRQPEAPPPVPYTVPHWSGTCSEDFFLLVVKNGVAMDTIPLLGKSHIVFGRLPSCDVRLEHPSISRHHAVIQFKPVNTTSDQQDQTASKLTTTYEAGFYVFDLGSTHGSLLNKHELNPRAYYRIRPGQMVRLGGSSRLFILEQGSGSQDVVEAEAEKEREDVRKQEQAHLQAQQDRAMRDMEREERKRRKEEEGVMWGMDYDFDEEPGAVVANEELDPKREAFYKDDPKKCIRKYFEREGLDLEYETEETGHSYNKTFHIRLKLPVDMATGEPVYAEGTSPSKKEATQLCALEACRLLDGYDMLRTSTQSHKAKQKNWEEADYYDSDEDTFLDRTGTVEKKRKDRMRRAGKLKDPAETFQSLKVKLEACQKEIAELEQTLATAKNRDGGGVQAGADSLESFMKGLRKQHELNKDDKYKIRQKISALTKNEGHLVMLINIVRPPGTPQYTSSSSSADPDPALAKPLPPGVLLGRPSLHKKTGVTSHKEPSKSFVSLRDRIEQAKQEQHQEKMEEEEEEEEEECKVKQGTDIEEGDGEAVKKMEEGQKSSPSSSVPKRRASSTGSQGNSPSVVPSSKKARQSGSDPATSNRRDSHKNHEDKKSFSAWMPPLDQSGDGRTHLNDKYGY